MMWQALLLRINSVKKSSPSRTSKLFALNYSQLTTQKDLQINHFFRRMNGINPTILVSCSWWSMITLYGKKYDILGYYRCSYRGMNALKKGAQIIKLLTLYENFFFKAKYSYKRHSCGDYCIDNSVVTIMQQQYKLSFI